MRTDEFIRRTIQSRCHSLLAEMTEPDMDFWEMLDQIEARAQAMLDFIQNERKKERRGEGVE